MPQQQPRLPALQLGAAGRSVPWSTDCPGAILETAWTVHRSNTHTITFLHDFGCNHKPSCSVQPAIALLLPARLCLASLPCIVALACVQPCCVPLCNCFERQIFVKGGSHWAVPQQKSTIVSAKFGALAPALRLPPPPAAARCTQAEQSACMCYFRSFVLINFCEGRALLQRAQSARSAAADRRALQHTRGLLSGTGAISGA